MTSLDVLCALVFGVVLAAAVVLGVVVYSVSGVLWPLAVVALLPWLWLSGVAANEVQAWVWRRLVR